MYEGVGAGRGVQPGTFDPKVGLQGHFKSISHQIHLINISKNFYLIFTQQRNAKESNVFLSRCMYVLTN